MSKRKDFSKEAQKSKPFTVRFPQSFVDEIKKERKIVKGQQIADFLVKMYDQTFHPIVANPVMERNRVEKPDDNIPGKIGKDVPLKGKIVAEKKRGLSDKFANAKLIVETENVPRGTSPVKRGLTPPPGLTGIDLRIWKEENGIK